MESLTWSEPLISPPCSACETTHFEGANCLIEMKDRDGRTGNWATWCNSSEVTGQNSP